MNELAGVLVENKHDSGRAAGNCGSPSCCDGKQCVQRSSARKRKRKRTDAIDLLLCEALSLLQDTSFPASNPSILLKAE